MKPFIFHYLYFSRRITRLIAYFKMILLLHLDLLSFDLINSFDIRICVVQGVLEEGVKEDHLYNSLFLVQLQLGLKTVQLYRSRSEYKAWIEQDNDFRSGRSSLSTWS